jgi:hypothetical protein
MIGDMFESVIHAKVREVLSESKEVGLPTDIIETDNLGEVIEKLAILHCRMWYLEDAISNAQSTTEVADLKKKIDICFKVKRPRYVEAINRMIQNAIVTGKTLEEDSVKLYKGFENEPLIGTRSTKNLTSKVRRTNLEDQKWIKENKKNWGPKI